MKMFPSGGQKPAYYFGEEYKAYAKILWGRPLPEGAELLGGYNDIRGAGALIRLANGNVVCGWNSVIRTIDQFAMTPSEFAAKQEQLFPEAYGRNEQMAKEVLFCSVKSVEAYKSGARLVKAKHKMMIERYEELKGLKAT